MYEKLGSQWALQLQFRMGWKPIQRAGWNMGLKQLKLNTDLESTVRSQGEVVGMNETF